MSAFVYIKFKNILLRIARRFNKNTVKGIPYQAIGNLLLFSILELVRGKKRNYNIVNIRNFCED